MLNPIARIVLVLVATGHHNNPTAAQIDAAAAHLDIPITMPLRVAVHSALDPDNEALPQTPDGAVAGLVVDALHGRTLVARGQGGRLTLLLPLPASA